MIGKSAQREADREGQSTAGPAVAGPRSRASTSAWLPALLVLGSTGLLLWIGDLLAPMLISLVVVYLLDGLAQRLIKAGVPRRPALGLLFGLFVCALALLLLYGLPLLWTQTVDLLRSVPALLKRIDDLLVMLAAEHPQLFEDTDILELATTLRQDLVRQTQTLLGLLPASAELLLNAGIYLLLVPLTAYFLLFDKEHILAWFGRTVPDHPALRQLWPRLLHRLGGYVRGKAYEVIIVSAVSTAAFYGLGLNWAVLLGTLTGLSCLIPIIGAIVAALPVLLVAYAQWGMDGQVVWVMVAYGIIQAIDGNVLQPLLLAETVGLHPVALIAAVLLCGGVFGIWGLLLAVPAAIAVQVLLEVQVGAD